MHFLRKHRKIISVQNETTACPNKMDSDIFAITQDWKELESCDFYHYAGK